MIQETSKDGSASPRRKYVSKYTLEGKKNEIFDALSSYNTAKLKSILQRIELEDSLSLPDLYDKDGHNLLHRAAYDNTFRSSEMLILFFKQRLAQHLKNLAIDKYGKQNAEQLSIDVINNIK